MAKVKIPEKYFYTKDDFQDFLENRDYDNCKWFYERIYESVKDSFKRGKSIANIFDAKIEETMITIRVTSEKQDWLISLKNALDWNIQVERYEVCSDIKTLIEDIETFENSSI